MPWLSTDKQRKGKTGQLGFRALLLQARGDWAWFKEIFAFPSWSAHSICWKCHANNSDCHFCNFGKNANWRTRRRTSAQFFANLIAQGLAISPIFDCPGFKLAFVVIGILHCLDLGVSPKILGNIMYEAMQRICVGRNQKQRAHALEQLCRHYYKRAHPSSCIQTLTYEMVKQPKKGPKLRTKGGETRGLIAFGLELTQRMVDHEDNEYTRTMHSMMQALFNVYMFISEDNYDAVTTAEYCRKCCILYGSLSRHAQTGSNTAKQWTISPKFHMFQELFEYQGIELMNPRCFWEYKDEDFVGFIAMFACSKGGPNLAATMAQRTIQRYRAWVG